MNRGLAAALLLCQNKGEGLPASAGRGPGRSRRTPRTVGCSPGAQELSLCTQPCGGHSRI